MICGKCGGEIDTRRRRADGSVQCPSCGTVYRPRSVQSRVPNKSRKRDVLSLIRSIPWKRRIWKFPLWAWAVFALLVLIAGLSGNSGDKNAFPAAAVPTAEPTAASTESVDWSAEFYAMEGEVRAYIDTVFSPYAYFIEPVLDCRPSEPNLYCVWAELTLNGSDDAAIREALRHIEEQTKDAPYGLHFDLSLMSESGTILCSVTFGDDVEGYNVHSSGGVKTCAAIDEISAEDIDAVQQTAKSSGYTDATAASFTADFEKCMAYLGYTAPLRQTESSAVDTGGFITTYMSDEWYGIMLWTDEADSASRITGATVFSSGDGSEESGKKVMSAYASTIYAFDHSMDAEKAALTVAEIMDGSRSYETDAVRISMGYTDVTGYTMIIEGKKPA